MGERNHRGAGSSTEQEPARSGVSPRQINWLTVVTACLVSVGLVLMSIAGVKSLGGAEVTTEEFTQIQQLSNDQLDAMEQDQLAGILKDLDAAADDHAAPAAVIEQEQVRVQGIWEMKWYGHQEELPVPATDG